MGYSLVKTDRKKRREVEIQKRKELRKSLKEQGATEFLIKTQRHYFDLGYKKGWDDSFHATMKSVKESGEEIETTREVPDTWLANLLSKVTSKKIMERVNE